MLPWLAVSAAVLIASGAHRDRSATSGRRAHAHDHAGHGHRSGIVWLLVVPVVLLIFVVPPALSARATTPATISVSNARSFPPLPAGRAPTVSLPEVLMRIAVGPVGGVDGRAITVTGFTMRDGDRVYLAKIVIVCCAADAQLARLHLSGPAASVAAGLPENTWVRVEGVVPPGQTYSGTDSVPDAGGVQRGAHRPARQHLRLLKRRLSRRIFASFGRRARRCTTTGSVMNVTPTLRRGRPVLCLFAVVAVVGALVIAAHPQRTPADPRIITGPYASLLSASTDLGTSRTQSVEVTAELRSGNRPTALIDWASGRELSVRWRPGDDWAVITGSASALATAFDLAVHEYRGRRGQLFYASPAAAPGPRLAARRGHRSGPHPRFHAVPRRAPGADAARRPGPGPVAGGAAAHLRRGFAGQERLHRQGADRRGVRLRRLRPTRPRPVRVDVRVAQVHPGSGRRHGLSAQR